MFFRLLKRRNAIKSFIYKLPLELHQRFGEKNYYSIEEIDHLFENGKYNGAFKTYAYALLCSRPAFDSYFRQLNVNCTYDGLRQFVAKKYFRGITDFDALSLIRFAKGVGDSSYRENFFGTSHGNDTAGSV